MAGRRQACRDTGRRRPAPILPILATWRPVMGQVQTGQCRRRSWPAWVDRAGGQGASAYSGMSHGCKRLDNDVVHRIGDHRDVLSRAGGCDDGHASPAAVGRELLCETALVAYSFKAKLAIQTHYPARPSFAHLGRRLQRSIG